MKMTTKRWIGAAVIAVIVGMALPAIASAQNGGVIYACFKTQNGQLRVIDINAGGCLASETLIQWNATGPQGPQGSEGPQGEQGERGPSDAWDVYRNPFTTVPVNGTSLATGTKILEINLPAGKFAITAKVNLSSNGGSGLVRCWTQSAVGWFDMGIASIGPNAGEALEATLTTSFTAQEAAPGPLSVTCWRQSGVGQPPVVGLAEAVAIQVANITTKQMPQ